MYRIEMLVADDVQLLDVAGPLQVFSTANELAATQAYEVATVSLAGGMIRSSSGLAFATTNPLRHTPHTLLVAGGPGMRAIMDDAAHVAWVRKRAKRAERIASICTGAFLLARTGVLDGRRATTHWAHCASLAAQHPAIRVDPDPIFIRNDPVWTSAGVTAGIDLALAMVETDHGAALALDVARHLVVFMKRPGGQSQFSDALAAQGRNAAPGHFDALADWIAGNLRRDLSLASLAARAGMSERSFIRHWSAATGTTPARSVENMRVEAARQALSGTSLPIKRIAAHCGFGSEESMRRCFQKRFAVSPQVWRDRFSSG